MLVAPGFIDSDSHIDLSLCGPNRLIAVAPMLLQGISSVIGGACGYSPAPVLGLRRLRSVVSTLVLSRNDWLPLRTTCRILPK